MLLCFIAEKVGLLMGQFSEPPFLNFSATSSFFFDNLLLVQLMSFFQQALINVRSLANFSFQPQELR